MATRAVHLPDSLLDGQHTAGTARLLREIARVAPDAVVTLAKTGRVTVMRGDSRTVYIPAPMAVEFGFSTIRDCERRAAIGASSALAMALADLVNR